MDIKKWLENEQREHRQLMRRQMTEDNGYLLYMRPSFFKAIKFD
jgi:hypothetical protein